MVRVRYHLVSNSMLDNRLFRDFATRFCDKSRLLITFANSLDTDQDRQNLGPDLDPNRLPLGWFYRNIF